MLKAIIAVHIAGLLADMKELHRLKKKYKFKIIEDASHALSTSLRKIKKLVHAITLIFVFLAFMLLNLLPQEKADALPK